MKYNIGERIRVKSLDWYNENKNEFEQIRCNTAYFQPTMSRFCGSILTIKNINIDTYNVEENTYYWTDDMFEGLAEEGIYDEEFKNPINSAYDACLDEYNEVPDKLKIVQVFISDKNYQDKVELCLGDDYEIVIEDGRTFVQRKKAKYPTTYEECCKTLVIQPDNIIITNCSGVYGTKYENNLIDKLGALWELIICRDAYWKIAGEEMELDKPWKQDYDDRCFIIANNNGNIHTYEYHGNNNVILAFPTAEMRDAFFENFTDLIEKCKHFL